MIIFILLLILLVLCSLRLRQQGQQERAEEGGMGGEHEGGAANKRPADARRRSKLGVGDHGAKKSVGDGEQRPNIPADEQTNQQSSAEAQAGAGAGAGHEREANKAAAERRHVAPAARAEEAKAKAAESVAEPPARQAEQHKLGSAGEQKPVEGEHKEAEAKPEAGVEAARKELWLAPKARRQLGGAGESKADAGAPAAEAAAAAQGQQQPLPPDSRLREEKEKQGARQVRPPMAEAEQQNLERRQDMARQQIRPPADQPDSRLQREEKEKQDAARQVRPPMAEAEQQNHERRQDMVRQQIRPPAQQLKRAGRAAEQVCRQSRASSLGHSRFLECSFRFTITTYRNCTHLINISFDVRVEVVGCMLRARVVSGCCAVLCAVRRAWRPLASRMLTLTHASTGRAVACANRITRGRKPRRRCRCGRGRALVHPRPRPSPRALIARRCLRPPLERRIPSRPPTSRWALRPTGHRHTRSVLLASRFPLLPAYADCFVQRNRLIYLQYHHMCTQHLYLFQSLEYELNSYSTLRVLNCLLVVSHTLYRSWLISSFIITKVWFLNRFSAQLINLCMDMHDSHRRSTEIC